MGYLNPGNRLFRMTLNSGNYVDKSMLLAFTNSRLDTERRFVCVSRPRRFGKSVTANMLASYYSCGCDSRDLFAGLKIAQDPGYAEHLNRYAVIHLNMIDFCRLDRSVSEITDRIDEMLRRELRHQYPCVNFISDYVPLMLSDVSYATGQTFVFVIDEWDCVIRDDRPESEKKVYLEYLNTMLKDKEYVSLAYMTGILPVKKYKGSQTILDMFDEFTMTDAHPIEEFTGFTEKEVMALCEKSGMPYQAVETWYKGYMVNEAIIYNPLSVVKAVESGRPDAVWTGTAAYDTAADFINSDVPGMREAVTSLLAGEGERVDIYSFKNDFTSCTSRDAILTALVHLGYLTYHHGFVHIPTAEMRRYISDVFKDSSNDA